MGKYYKSIIISLVLSISFIVLGACAHRFQNGQDAGVAQDNSKRNYGTDYKKACEDSDFEIAHIILNRLRESALKEPLNKTNYNNVVSTQYKEYEEADLYIFKQECAYLLESDLEGAEKVIIKLISDTPFDGTRIDEGSYEGVSIFENLSNDYGEESLYVHCINRYNEKCNYALGMACTLKEEELMDNLIGLFKDNVVFEIIKKEKELIGGDVGRSLHREFGYHKVKCTSISYEPKDRNAAISKYNLAENNSIKCQTSKISGPLGKYFEIVPNEKEYTFIENVYGRIVFSVEIKRIKAGEISGFYYLVLSLLDDNNSVKASSSELFSGNDELLVLEEGESTYVSFEFYSYCKKDLTSVTHFKIGSSK